MERDVKRRFFVALALTIPVAALAGHLPGLPSLLHPPLSNWIGLVLSTPVVWWCGWMFIAGSVRALRYLQLDMSVLIATGVLASYLSSIYLTVIGSPSAYFEAAAMLVTFVLFGHWMEMKSRRGTSDALQALFKLVPPTARVVRGGEEVEVPTVEVRPGEKLRLRPGDRVPVDGTLAEGETDVDEALLTGESKPVHKRPGDKLVGGAINLTSAAAMTATQVGKDTVLAQIAAMVERAQNSKAPAQRLADRAAAVLVVVAVGSGVLTYVAWRFVGHSTGITALTFAIAAVVIACPDALGLATPTAVAVGTGLGARHGILIKDAATLEGLSRITAVILDKTGTLTVGKPSVAFPQPNGLAGFVERVGLVDVLAQSGKSCGRKIDCNDRKLWVVELRAERAKPVGEQHRALGAGQCFHCDPARERFSVAIIVAPADLQIFETGVIPLGWPDPARDVQSLHGQACVKRAVIDHVNGPRGLAGPGRIERFSGSSTGTEERYGDESDLPGRSHKSPDQPKAIFHPDNSPRTQYFQRMGPTIAA